MNIKDKAIELHNQGFAVIPTGQGKDKDKAPIPSNWQSYQTDRQKPNGNFDRAAGCGVVTGQQIGDYYTAAIDVDCYVKAISREVCDFIAELTDTAIAYRVGEAPKFLVPILIEKKIKKQCSNRYDTDDGKKNRIEILCDGQQFIAYGRHAKASKGCYEWYNGKLDINALPKMSVYDVESVLAFYNKVMDEYEGASIVNEKPLVSTVSNEFISGIDDLPIDGLSQDEVKAYLSHIPASVDHDTWNTVGMALHHQYSGSDDGFKLWDSWSKTDPQSYDGDLINVKWNSYGNHTGVPVRFASVIALSKQYKAKATEAIFDAPVSTPVSAPAPALRFNQINDDVWANQKVQKWLIKGVLEQATVNAIYGPPKTGKSFVAIDMALHIAHGMDWCEKKVKAGTVCYIAGEGTLGVERRIAAWRLEHNVVGGSDFYLSKQNFILTDSEQLKTLIASLDGIHAESPLSMIVIDTYARALGGDVDENSTGETGRVIKILDAIKDRYDASVTIIHHSPKGAGSSLRGSGALQGALDSSMSVEKKNDTIVVTCRDQKDAGDFGKLGFSLISYDLPTSLYIDNFNEGVSSAVAKYDPDYDADNDKSGVKLSPSGAAVKRAFDDEFNATNVKRVPVPADIIRKYGLDSATEGLWSDDVRDRFYRQDSSESTSTKRSKWNRGLNDAKQKEYFEELDDVIFKL